MTANEHLKAMFKADEELYQRILDTADFVYHFNELAKLAQERDRIMAEGQVRVLRVIEYVGDRRWVEEPVDNSLHGVKKVETKTHGSGEIRVATVGNYPELLRNLPEVS